MEQIRVVLDAPAQSFRPGGEPPFGLIGESESDDLESFFDKIFSRIESGIDDIRDKIDDIL